MDSTLAKGSVLIAKSPSSERTLISRDAGRVNREAALVGAGAALQLISGVLMIAFGVLCASYGVTLSRLGAGLWGGLVSSLAGLLGALAAVHACSRRRPAALYLTAYLALCLVSLAVNTLVLVLTLTAVVRDSNVDPDLLPTQDGSGLWAGQWCGVGLMCATSLHLLCTLVSLPVSCKRRGVGGGSRSSPPPSPPFLHDPNKQTMIDSWLGHHHYPPPHHHHPYFIGMERGRMGPVYTVPYPPRTPSRHKEREHREREHREREQRSREQRQRRQSPAPESVKKEKRKEKEPEITEEELDKTYTGLDREIAEEFISIAMQPKPASSVRSESSISHVFP